MGIQTLIWKLGSPYDAYTAHVSRLNTALDRIRYISDRALGYEAGLQSSVRLVPGSTAREERVERFREQLGKAASTMSDEEFEDFLAHLGGGEAASQELGAVARPAPDIDHERGVLGPDAREQIGRRPGPLRLEPPV